MALTRAATTIVVTRAGRARWDDPVVQQVGDLEIFERALMRAIDRMHECPCDVCAAEQRSTEWLAVLGWIGVADDEQVGWLESHPPTELRGAVLRELLERYAAVRDLGAIKHDWEERRLYNERRRAALEER
jgi:hypothetical protein